MFDFHKDKKRYFDWQYFISRDFILPFISSVYPSSLEGKRVMEIGCAEAGVLKAFTDKKCKCVGVELQKSRLEHAKHFLKNEMNEGLISFIANDIYDINPKEDFEELFDVIILKDVIEHIHNQEKFINQLKEFLVPGGIVFFAFPPWTMPFGGHQQLMKNKWFSKLPYTHLFPSRVYSKLMKWAGETPQKINGLLEIKTTGISTKRFERIVKNNSFTTLKKQLYLFNPIYQYKFGLKPKKQFKLISKLPANDWITSCAYYLIQKSK